MTKLNNWELNLTTTSETDNDFKIKNSVTSCYVKKKIDNLTNAINKQKILKMKRNKTLTSFIACNYAI